MLRFIGMVLVAIVMTACSPLPPIEQGQTLDDYLNAQAFSGAVLVAQGDEILHVGAYGFADRQAQRNNTVHTRFPIASLSKAFTAAAILQLQEQGRLSLDDTLDRHLPDFPAAERITVRQLLNHSAGLADYVDDWQDFRYQAQTPQALVARFKDQPLEFEPGSDTAYSSSGFVLAGVLIEKLSGKSYAEYLQSHVFKPLAMSNSTYGYPQGDKAVRGYEEGALQKATHPSAAYAAGGISSTVHDMHRWALALFDKRFLNEASLAEIFPQDRNAPGMGFGTGRFKVVFGLGWGIYKKDYGLEYAHSGHVDGFSSVIALYPQQQLNIVILSNEGSYEVYELKKRIAEFVLADFEQQTAEPY